MNTTMVLALLSQAGVRTYTALEDDVLRALARTTVGAVRFDRAVACNSEAHVLRTLCALTKRKVPLVRLGAAGTTNAGYVLTDVGRAFVVAKGWA